jgi:AAA domain-containing protein
MPIPADSLEHDQFLRMLLMGIPKGGKSSHAIATAPSPVRVLLCESDSALIGAKRESNKFDFERVSGFGSMTKFIVEAKRDAKEGKIKSLVVDPLNMFADTLFEECLAASKSDAGNEDGRKAHPEFTRRIKHVINLLMTIPAHLVVVSHYMEVGGGDDNDKPKYGRGICPLMPNMASRTAVAAMFYDVVWFDQAKATEPNHYNNRIFVTGPDGAWGVGCRSLSKNEILPAHIGKFIERMREVSKTEVRPMNGKPAKAQQPMVKR